LKKDIGVARIVSGAIFFFKKLMTYFSRRPPKYTNTENNTVKLTTTILKRSPPSKTFLKNWLIALPAGALTTYSYKLRQFFLALVVHVHSMHPRATLM